MSEVDVSEGSENLKFIEDAMESWEEGDYGCLLSSLKKINAKSSTFSVSNGDLEISFKVRFVESDDE